MFSVCRTPQVEGAFQSALHCESTVPQGRPQRVLHALAFLESTCKQGLLFFRHTPEWARLAEWPLIFIQADVHIRSAGESEKKIFTAEKGTGLEISYGKGRPLRVSPRIQPGTVKMGFRVRSARGRNNEMSAKEESVEIDFSVGRPCLAGSTKPATLR